MKPRKRDKFLDKAANLLKGRSRASSPAPSEHPSTIRSSAAASASSPSGNYLEPLRTSAKERPGFSSAAPSQSSSVVPSTVNTPLLSASYPESSNLPGFSQISANNSPHLSSAPSTDHVSSTSSPEALAVPELQPLQHSQDSPPSAPLALTSSEAQVYPDTLRSPSKQSLWSRAIEEAKSENGTLRWLQKNGLVSTDSTQQLNQKSLDISQTQMDEKFEIEELISLIEANKLSEQNDKPMKIQIGKREVIIRDYIANTVAFITKVGYVAFAFAPAEARAPWAIARAALQIPVHQVEQKAALLGTVKWFTGIVRRGQIYETLYTAESIHNIALEGLQDSLLQVYTAAIKMLAKSDNLFNSGVARQTLTAILEPDYSSDTIKNLVEKERQLDREIHACEVSRSTLSSSFTNEQIRDLEKQLFQLSAPLPQIEKGVASLLSKLEKDKLDKLLEFISQEMFGKSHASVAEKRTKDTGGWLLANKEFHAWQRTSSSALLCLKGTIGTGKTYLASKAIDYIKQTLESSPQHNEGFAFFYCNRSGRSMQDPLIALRSFVRQLAGKAFDTSGVVQHSLVQRCEEIQKEKREFTYKDCEDLLLESFNLYTRTTIVLDALDETDVTDYNLGAILTTIMRKSENPIKIFISSRPDREYLEAFADETVITVDASNQHEDIERFLAEKLYSTGFFQQRSPGIQNEIRNVFATRSCGMFRWVHLQVMSLKRCITNNAIHNWACNLPGDLMAAYDQLWENLIREHDESDVALARRAIMWVLCSFEPLVPEFLPQAIWYVVQGSKMVPEEEQTEQQILLLCQDLLTIDGSGAWTLPHASVAEYFEKRGGMRLWECDVFVAKTCFSFLAFDRVPLRYDYGFERYVKSHCFHHVERYEKWLGSREQELEQEPDQDFAAALRRFLGSPDKGSAAYHRWDSQWAWPSIPLSTICRHGLYYTLRDWWTQPGKITAEMALKKENDHDALNRAAAGGCMHIFRHLVKLIEHVHPKGDTYWISPLKSSIRTYHSEVMEFLVTEMKADVNSADQISTLKETAVQVAAGGGNPKMLQWLVDQGVVDLERENDSEWDRGNALIAASRGHDIKSVRILLKAGANANVAVQNGHLGSALIAAASETWSGCIETTQILLDHNADPNLPSKTGGWGSALEASMEPIWISKYDEDRRNLQFLLLEAGADPTTVSEYGNYGSALAAAAFCGRTESLKAMIDKVGAKRAIEVFRQSRHPKTRWFQDQQEVIKWKKTATYLAEEVGVSREILHTIGFWEVEPEPYHPNSDKSIPQDGFILRYLPVQQASL
ncbi:hypothetical protein HDV63DRAFT_362000 [Trichoderma sp. SZMC 28014]